MAAFSDEIYPNSPLVEVVFQIRFPGELAIECQRHEFWELIRSDYPNIRVPKAVRDEALALSPYRFVRLDEQLTVMLALNSLALSASTYPGFRAFKKEFLRIHSLFAKVFRVEKLTRAGWRYINVIPFVRQEGLIPLNQFLRLGFRLPESIPERLKSLNLAFDSVAKGANIRVQLDTLTRDDGDQEALLLDFDYGKDGALEHLSFSKTEEYLDEAHGFTRQLFEDLITDEYRQFLKGDVL